MKQTVTINEAYKHIKSLLEMQQYEQMQVVSEEILQQRPDDLNALYFLALSFDLRKEYHAARGKYEAVLAINPEHYPSMVNLANILQAGGEFMAGLELQKKANKVNPDDTSAYNNLANSFTKLGDVKEATRYFKMVLDVDPKANRAHSNLMLNLLYDSELDFDTLYKEHRHWEELQTKDIEALPTKITDFSPDRPLRIGYLSGDYNMHPVSYYIGNILANHDKSKFQPICFANQQKHDKVTESIQRMATEYYNVHTMSYPELANFVQEKQIDILMDLSGHTKDNRMPLFAYKPAPIQVSYLGYAYTSGMEAIDYRFTDAMIDPPPEAQKYYTEKLIYLPHGCHCYTAPTGCPDANYLPARKNNFISFSIFHNPCKVNKNMMQIWARLLEAVPDSKLFMKNIILRDPQVKAIVTEQFKETGVPEDRLVLYNYDTTYFEHLSRFHHIDIALDTSPYNGTTTTCESLWMGVPVITLCGDKPQSRVSASIINRIGLGDLIAYSADEYIEKAKALANDLDKLESIRLNLRANMQNSTLMNGALMAEAIETAYREMWIKYCEQQTR